MSKLLTACASLVLLMTVARGVAAETPFRLRPGDLVAIAGDKIVHIDPASGKSTVLVSTYDAEPRFQASGLVVGTDGQIYLDHGTSIDRFDPISGDLVVIASATVGGGAPFDGVHSMTLGPDGLLYYYSSRQGSSSSVQIKLYSVDPTTGFRTLVASGAATEAIRHLVALPDGRFLSSLSDSGRLLRLVVSPPARLPVVPFGPTLYYVSSLAADASGDTAYVTWGNGTPIVLSRIPVSGGNLTTVLQCVTPYGGPSSQPYFTSVALAPDGAVYAATRGDVVACAPSIPYSAATTIVIRIDPTSGRIDEIHRSEPSLGLGSLTDLAIVPAGLRLPDVDADDTPDAFDNCPSIANADQTDADQNGVGDACNTFEDFDGDDYADSLDGCPEIFDPAQHDADADGLGDPCDPFPDDPNHRAAELDRELDRVSEELAMCRAEQDGDDDLDGIPDWMDGCLATPPHEPVDVEGCSVAQFCRSIVDSGHHWRRTCAQADWADPSRRRDRPWDCHVRRSTCEARSGWAPHRGSR